MKKDYARTVKVTVTDRGLVSDIFSYCFSLFAATFCVMSVNA